MTDNEIIKALECCTYNITQEKCDECPLYGGHCTTELARNTLDLINRQQAEIEKLKTDLKEVGTEYERLDDVVSNGAEVCHNCHAKYDEKIK